MPRRSSRIAALIKKPAPIRRLKVEKGTVWIGPGRKIDTLGKNEFQQVREKEMLTILDDIESCANKIGTALFSHMAVRPKEYVQKASVFIATKFIFATHTVLNNYLCESIVQVLFNDAVYFLEEIQPVKDLDILRTCQIRLLNLEANVFDYFDFQYICDGPSMTKHSITPIDDIKLYIAIGPKLKNIKKKRDAWTPKRSPKIDENETSSLDLLRRMLSEYQIDETKFGDGAFSTVYKAIERKHPSNLLALKSIKKKYPFGSREYHDTYGLTLDEVREICIIRKFESPYIINFTEVMYFPVQLLLFMPLLKDLLQYKKEHLVCKKAFLMPATKQLLRALQFLKESNILHRDIKLENILVDIKSFTLKLSDFGLARFDGNKLHKKTMEVVTLWYRAPELLLGEEKYGASVDMWSVACVLVALASSSIAWFQGDSEIGQLFKIFEKLGLPPDGSLRSLPDYNVQFPKFIRQTPIFTFSESSDLTVESGEVNFKYAKKLTGDGLKFYQLIEGMVVFDPEKRITPENALKVVSESPDEFSVLTQ